jgi:Pvc16 N-terminal domain
MSTPLAVATVTAVLQNFLQNSVTDLAAVLGGNVTVSTEPPDRIDIGTASPDRINLFLFQAAENQGWRNLALPSRSANGDRISNPYLALDLSYLLTAYGSGPLHAEVLLGQGMFVLHEMPILTRDAIRAVTLSPPQPPLLAGLTISELADQIEQIKIVPQVTSVEEISKIWSALQSQYRPTAVYKASVVLIESKKSVRPTLPVRARSLLVVPFENPTIDLIQSQASAGAEILADQPFLAGYNLVIDGQRLRGETTLVFIDEAEIVPNDDQIGATRIIVPLPASLQPGLHAVQVVHPANFGTFAAPVFRGGVESNVVAFILSPEITTPAPIAAPRNTTLTLAINPPIGRAQRATLIAGGGTVSIPARPAAGPDTTPTLDFPIPGDFPTGPNLLLRVQIDGAQSPLEVDAGGQFNNPTIAIT